MQIKNPIKRGGGIIALTIPCKLSSSSKATSGIHKISIWLLGLSRYD